MRRSKSSAQQKTNTEYWNNFPGIFANSATSTAVRSIVVSRGVRDTLRASYIRQQTSPGERVALNNHFLSSRLRRWQYHSAWCEGVIRTIFILLHQRRDARSAAWCGVFSAGKHWTTKPDGALKRGRRRVPIHTHRRERGRVV